MKRGERGYSHQQDSEDEDIRQEIHQRADQDGQKSGRQNNKHKARATNDSMSRSNGQIEESRSKHSKHIPMQGITPTPSGGPPNEEEKHESQMIIDSGDHS